MKKQLLTLTLAIFSFGIHAQVPNYVPTNGLVAYYPFNGNANDESVNTNDGTIVGALLTADRNSVLNSAYDFDFASASFGAQNDEIYIPYNPLLNVNFTSVSVWLYPRSYFWTGDAGNPNSTILARFQYTYSTPSGGAWGINFNQTSVTGFIVGPTGGAGGASAISNTPLALNTWHHIVMTYDGANVKLYVDGSLSGIQSHTDAMNIAGNSGISIGESNQANGYWQHTDGNIDDIGIWNRALSECEIQDLYNSQLNTIASSVTLNVATLTADLSGASYEWLDCGNGNAQIVGELNQSFTPSAQTGNYSVEITMNGCVDTSSCYLVDYTGINELNSNKSKKLLKIVDFMGREISYKKNTPMIFIYEDGTVERLIEAE